MIFFYNFAFWQKNTKSHHGGNRIQGPTLVAFEGKAISYTVEFVSRKRPFLTEAQIGLSYTVEKRLFRLNFCRLRFPTGGSGRKTRFFRLDGQLSRKSFTRVFLTDRIAHPTTKTHTHTATRPHTHTRYHTAVSYTALTLAWLSLLLLLAASQRGAFLVPLASSARSRSHAANKGCACCSFGGSRLSATPRT